MKNFLETLPTKAKEVTTFAQLQIDKQLTVNEKPAASD
jgi:hypothetical protein